MIGTDLDILVSYKDAKGARHHKNVYVTIPDDFVEEYAREVLGLTTFDEAIQDYEPEPPERDDED